MSSSFFCRICGGSSTASLVEILDLGVTPLANRLVKKSELSKPEPEYPLRLVFCPSCSLVQITETVPPEELFSEYLYLSSYSTTMLEHSRLSAEHLIERFDLTSDSLVVEIASNDGYMLQFYQAAGIPVLGIEPARNIAALANERGIPTRCEFFSKEVGSALCDEGLQTDLLLGNNVLAHVADLHGLVSGIRNALKLKGAAVLEFPYVRDMIDHVEFDTIYHEHLCYFSLTAVSRLFEQHELVITDVQRLSIHGGSLRITAGLRAGGAVQQDSVKAMLVEEATAGLCNVQYYLDFAAAAHRVRERFCELLGELDQRGCTVAGYGAAAKACTLLHFCGIGNETITYVVDRNPVKQGLYLAGTHIPIEPVERFNSDRPDVVVVFPWNLRDEIVSQLTALRSNGTRFLIPLPEPVILS